MPMKDYFGSIMPVEVMTFYTFQSLIQIWAFELWLSTEFQRNHKITRSELGHQL